MYNCLGRGGNMRILLAEDEKRMAAALAALLRQEKYDVDHMADGASALTALESGVYDIAVLDVMMPEMNGFEVSRQARNKGIKTPILMLTAKSQLDDKVEGLDSGADDYLIKPFGIMELVSRCKALLRRANRLMPVLAYETIEMDDERHRVTADGVDVELTFKEYALLKYLLENSGTAVTRERLMDAVWGFAFTGETRTVDMHIKTLRKKLGPSGALILTVRNVGYQLGR